MAAVFERIRAAVLQEATRPSPDDSKQHVENQAALTAKLQEVCTNAHLRSDMTTDDLWWHVWTKIRYAGFRAAFVAKEIPRLKPFLNDFRVLTGSEWRFDPEGIGHGEAVRDFLEKKGRFADIDSYNTTIINSPKLSRPPLRSKPFGLVPSRSRLCLAMITTNPETRPCGERTPVSPS